MNATIINFSWSLVCMQLQLHAADDEMSGFSIFMAG
jgi:hypothetical protein